MLAGGVVQSTIGFGLAVVAAPFVVLARARPDAGRPPRARPGGCRCSQLSHGDRDIAWRPLGWALGARTLFTPVGVAVVAWFSPRAIAALVGVLILVTVALSVRTIDLRATPRNAAVAGAVSGVSGTAAAIGGRSSPSCSSTSDRSGCARPWPSSSSPGRCSGSGGCSSAAS